MPNFNHQTRVSPKQMLLASAALLAIAVPSALPAQQATAPASAAKSAVPIPAQILTAKKVFISNAGADAESKSLLVDKEMDANSAYAQFYDLTKAWNRFALVSAPTDADVVLEISFTSPDHDCSRGPCEDPQLALVVYDARTHFRLWTFTERIETAILASTWKKNFTTAVESLVLDFKQLTNSPS